MRPGKAARLRQKSRERLEDRQARHALIAVGQARREFTATPAHLTASTIRAVPAAGSFKISSTTVDGHGRAMLACAVCSWYGYHVSSRIGGRIGDLFAAADLTALNEQTRSHQCPPEVTEAAAEARAARAAAPAGLSAGI